MNEKRKIVDLRQTGCEMAGAEEASTECRVGPDRLDWRRTALDIGSDRRISARFSLCDRASLQAADDTLLFRSMAIASVTRHSGCGVGVVVVIVLVVVVLMKYS